MKWSWGGVGADGEALAVEDAVADAELVEPELLDRLEARGRRPKRVGESILPALARPWAPCAGHVGEVAAGEGPVGALVPLVGVGDELRERAVDDRHGLAVDLGAGDLEERICRAQGVGVDAADLGPLGGAAVIRLDVPVLPVQAGVERLGELGAAHGAGADRLDDGGGDEGDGGVGGYDVGEGAFARRVGVPGGDARGDANEPRDAGALHPAPRLAQEAEDGFAFGRLGGLGHG